MADQSADPSPLWGAVGCLLWPVGLTLFGVGYWFDWWAMDLLPWMTVAIGASLVLVPANIGGLREARGWRETAGVVGWSFGVLALMSCMAWVGWWLAGLASGWVGGPQWLYYLLVGMPLGRWLVGWAVSAPVVVAAWFADMGTPSSRTPRAGGVKVKYQAECYAVDRPGGFPMGPTLVEGEAANGSNPAIAHGAKAIRRSLELGVPVEVEPGVGWQLLAARADHDADPVAPNLTGLVHSGADRILTVRLWPPSVDPHDTSPPAEMTAALEDEEVRIVYIDEEPDRALLQLVAGSVAEYWRRIVDNGTIPGQRKGNSRLDVRARPDKRTP